MLTKFFKDNTHIYRFYFVTSVVAIIVSIALIYFIADHVRLKDLVGGKIISKTSEVKVLVPTDQKYHLNQYRYLNTAIK